MSKPYTDATRETQPVLRYGKPFNSQQHSNASSIAFAVFGHRMTSMDWFYSNFHGDFIHKIAKQLAPWNFRSFNSHKYVGCLILRPVTVSIFSRMQTSSQNTWKLIHCKILNVYGIESLLQNGRSYGGFSAWLDTPKTCSKAIVVIGSHRPYLNIILPTPAPGMGRWQGPKAVSRSQLIEQFVFPACPCRVPRWSSWHDLSSRPCCLPSPLLDRLMGGKEGDTI